MPSKTHIDGLDPIRIFAALNVALFHYTGAFGMVWGFAENPAFSVGFSFGVPAFFIVSGFLIPSTVNKYSPATVIAKRYARLLPGLLACSIIALLFIFLNPIERYESVNIGNWLASLTMMPQVIGFDFIDGPYWTLQTQMYFLLLLLGVRVVGLWRHLTLIFALILILGAFALSYNWLAYPFGLPTPFKQLGNIGLAFFQFHHIHFFALGFLLARYRSNDFRWPEWLLLFLCIGYEHFVERMGMLSLVILATIVAGFLLLRIPYCNHPVIKRMAELSFCFYLLHGAVGYITIHALHKQHGVDPTLSVLVALLLVGALSYIINRLIERPGVLALQSALKSLFKARSAPSIYASDPESITSGPPLTVSHQSIPAPTQRTVTAQSQRSEITQSKGQG